MKHIFRITYHVAIYWKLDSNRHFPSVNSTHEFSLPSSVTKKPDNDIIIELVKKDAKKRMLRNWNFDIEKDINDSDFQSYHIYGISFSESIDESIDVYKNK